MPGWVPLPTPLPLRDAVSWDGHCPRLPEQGQPRPRGLGPHTFGGGTHACPGGGQPWGSAVPAPRAPPTARGRRSSATRTPGTAPATPATRTATTPRPAPQTTGPGPSVPPLPQPPVLVTTPSPRRSVSIRAPPRPAAPPAASPLRSPASRPARRGGDRALPAPALPVLSVISVPPVPRPLPPPPTAGGAERSRRAWPGPAPGPGRSGGRGKRPRWSGPGHPWVRPGGAVPARSPSPPFRPPRVGPRPVQVRHLTCRPLPRSALSGRGLRGRAGGTGGGSGWRPLSQPRAAHAPSHGCRRTSLWHFARRRRRRKHAPVPAGAGAAAARAATRVPPRAAPARGRCIPHRCHPLCPGPGGAAVAPRTAPVRHREQRRGPAWVRTTAHRALPAARWVRGSRPRRTHAGDSPRGVPPSMRAPKPGAGAGIGVAPSGRPQRVPRRPRRPRRESLCPPVSRLGRASPGRVKRRDRRGGRSGRPGIRRGAGRAQPHGAAGSAAPSPPVPEPEPTRAMPRGGGGCCSRRRGGGEGGEQPPPAPAMTPRVGSA
ncbi:basic proline-rich protein-like [Serinus canaria]|uniref:basic proline-rich protein-like n=1 Tax=Serinus canaria TaxID=9135 RepID=UPI0021CCAB0F|nr:basic proline-rich protein-like [Serinus canaria]